MSKVSIHKIKDQSYENIKEAVEQVIHDLGGLKDIIKEGDRVLIKPNLVAVPTDRLSGAVTRWEVVLAIAECVAKEGACPFVAESASAGEDTQMVMLRCEYDKITEAGYPLLDLKKEEAAEISVKKGSLVKKLKTWKPVAEADVIISVPVMKTHDQTEVTLGLKNLKGLIADNQKKEFHRIGVVKGVADMVSRLKPAMTIIDGTFGQEGIGPVFGDTVKMDLILGSKDVVACDAVASAVMGYDPAEAMITKEAYRRKLGEMKLSQIEVVGEPIDKVKRRFLRASEVKLPGVAPHTLLMDESTCTGCRNTVRSCMIEFQNHQNSDCLKGKTIVTGPVKKLPGHLKKEDTILVGKCTAHLKDQGIWVPGCPPENEYVIDAILKGSPKDVEEWEDDLEESINRESFQQMCKEQIGELVNNIKNQGELLSKTCGYPVIDNVTWRVKSPESIRKKLAKKEREISFESARKTVHDMIGIRVVCPFQDDVYKIAEAIRNIEGIAVKKEKNYISHPKESGYRSIHLILEIQKEIEEKVDVEVQIRSVAMNYWAILDHLLCYKNETKETESVRRQLKEYAIAIAKIDKKFLKLRKKIEKM